MPSESIHNRMERTRRPPVHIKFEVDNDGAIEEKEIPLVVGVMSDLAGHRTEPPAPLAERNFRLVDRDNFNAYLKSVGPRLQINVENTLQKKQQNQPDAPPLKVEINFESMDDFDPERLVQNIGPLKELIQLRRRLAILRNKLGGNDRFENLLQDILKNTGKRDQLISELGLSSEPAPAPAPAAAASAAKPAADSPSSDDSDADDEEPQTP